MKEIKDKKYMIAVQNIGRIEELHIIIGNNLGFRYSAEMLKEYTDLMSWFESTIYHGEKYRIKEPVGYQLN